jgi:hypothetical protein
MSHRDDITRPEMVSVKPCPWCKARRLLSVPCMEEPTRSTSDERVELASGPRLLVCSACGRVSHPPEMHATIRRLEDQAVGFLNPDEAPSRCPSCSGGLTAHPWIPPHVRPMLQEGDRIAEIARVIELIRSVYHCCLTCELLVWLEPSRNERRASNDRLRAVAS